MKELYWVNHDTLPMYMARSEVAPQGVFRIFYDDNLYWCNFTKDGPTSDLQSLKDIAQRIHNSYK